MQFYLSMIHGILSYDDNFNFLNKFLSQICNGNNCSSENCDYYKGCGYLIVVDALQGNDNALKDLESFLVKAYHSAFKHLIDLSILLVENGDFRMSLEPTSSFYEMQKDGTVITLANASSFAASIKGSRALSNAGSFTKYSRVVLGGSFDHLHAGHKVLLGISALLAQDELIVGISDGPLLERKKYLEMMEPYSERERKVRNFLSLSKPTLALQTVPLMDPFGPTITDPNVDCIVVSTETLQGATAINEKRRSMGFKELHVHCIDLVYESSECEKVSSTFIRKQLLALKKG